MLFAELSDAFWTGFWTAIGPVLLLILAELKREIDKRAAIKERNEFKLEVEKNAKEAVTAVKDNTKITEEIGKRVEKVEQHSNSMREDLVAAVERAAGASGELRGLQAERDRGVDVRSSPTVSNLKEDLVAVAKEAIAPVKEVTDEAKKVVERGEDNVNKVEKLVAIVGDNTKRVEKALDEGDKK